jgi:hypothetical protein
MASKVKETIGDKIKGFKVFYHMLDCTRDTGPIGQMIILLRKVDTETCVSKSIFFQIYCSSGNNCFYIDGHHFERTTKSRSQHEWLLWPEL